MNDSNYKNYSDLTLDELEEVVVELENLSIKALKEKKKSLRNQILHSVAEAIKEIQVVRGAASLQYGTQFGGLINFIMK